MNSVKQLSDHEFILQPRKNGNILACTLKGFSLIVFKTSNCPYCSQLGPVLTSLSKKIPQCKFAMANVTNYPKILEASRKSIKPIDYVPFIIFYVNSKPFLEYKGDKSENGIGNFVMSVMNQLQNTKGFSENSIIDSDEVQETIGGVIPYNSIKCDLESGLCYLTNKEINGSKPQQGGGQAPQQTARETLAGMYDPSVQHRRNNLNNYSGM